MPLEPLNDRTSGWRRAVNWVRSVFIVTIFLSTLLALNLAQTASLVLIPFSKSAFRRFNRWCANTWWGACVVSAERLNHTRLVLTGADLPERENAIVYSNHQQMPDITTIMALARRKHRLGDLKFFVKKAIKWVPGVGWGMQFIDCLFIRRNWTADRESIRHTFDKVVQNRIPLWLVSFVEGTRITPAKLARSQDFARSHGLEPTRHVLLPRTKGFAASISGLGEHVAAVYDLTIGYVDGVPNLWQHVKGSVKEVHLHVRRFPISELPEGEDNLRQWLLDRFYEKDQLLEHFYLTGSFPKQALSTDVQAA